MPIIILKFSFISKLKNIGIEIHARSLFLQGLLLMEINEIPEYFLPIKRHLQNYISFLKDEKLSLLEGALCFANQIKQVDIGLVGVTNAAQLNGIINANNRIKKRRIDFSEFSLADCDYINPASWKY